jgi:uncharacterized SAM-binding protein YcdF (DUF218 family)
VSDLDPLVAVTPAAGAPDVAVADPTPVGGIPIARNRSWPIRLLVGVMLIVLLAITYYTVTLVQVHSTGQSDQTRDVDAIVVMGAAQYDGRPSPQLAARLDHAAELWSEGVAKVMVVTGGNQPGDRFTEAEASADYLVERGVPAGAILQEGVSHSTYASLAGVATLLHQRGLFRVLLVTDPFHSLRARLTAQELGLVAYVSPTRTSPVQGNSATTREMQEAAGIALGRIVGFKRLLSLTG